MLFAWACACRCYEKHLKLHAFVFLASLFRPCSSEAITAQLFSCVFGVRVSVPLLLVPLDLEVEFSWDRWAEPCHAMRAHPQPLCTDSGLDASPLLWNLLILS